MLFLLCEDQKQNHVFVSKELVDRANAVENFVKNIITGGKIWIHSFGIETKAPVLTVGLGNVTHTQKSTASLVQCRSDADCVL